MKRLVVLLLLVPRFALPTTIIALASAQPPPREPWQSPKNVESWGAELSTHPWQVSQLSPSIQTVEINAIDSGWYVHTGYHGPTNTNYVVGECALPECPQSTLFRNFFVFDLTAISEQILSASLVVENPPGGYVSADPSETWTTFDVSTPITTLVAGGSGLTDIYNDLGSGTSYGSAIATSSSTMVQVQLNSAAISALNTTAGGQFAIGGAVTTLDTVVNREWVFGNTEGPRVRKLVLSVSSAGQATLSVNYTDGSPGSFFTLTGADFPPNSTASIVVNGRTLTSTLAVDSSGGLMFRLDTNQADPGRYFATVSVNPNATTSFLLDSTAPLRPLEGSGPIIAVPSGIAFTQFVYLPLIQR